MTAIVSELIEFFFIATLCLKPEDEFTIFVVVKRYKHPFPTEEDIKHGSTVKERERERDPDELRRNWMHEGGFRISEKWESERLRL